MSAAERFDGELQMFVDKPRDAKQEHLRFLRWLVEREQLERPISDQPGDGPVETWSALIDRPSPNRACVPRWFGR
jgi:hypothetical protein